MQGNDKLQMFSPSDVERHCCACGRVSKSKPAGAIVNAIGCTGACLGWVMDMFGDILASAWPELEWMDADCDAVIRICSDLDDHGWALVNSVHSWAEMPWCPNVSLIVFLEYMNFLLKNIKFIG